MAPIKWLDSGTHRVFRYREKVLLVQHDFDRLPFKLDELRTEWDYRSDGPKIYWKVSGKRRRTTSNMTSATEGRCSLNRSALGRFGIMLSYSVKFFGSLSSHSVQKP